jgi:alpha-tubulin suppressor-like RCC1 family protein
VENNFLILKESGNLYTWGELSFGKLGRPMGSDFHVKLPVKAVNVVGGSNHTLILT